MIGKDAYESAHMLWEVGGQQEGMEAEHWLQAERDIDSEDDDGVPDQDRDGRSPGRKAADEAAATGRDSAQGEDDSRTRTRGLDPC